MTIKQVTVGIEEFDAHVIALCVQTANRYSSTLMLTDGSRKLNAKSMMCIMAMGLALGDTVTVTAEGSDEKEAAEAVGNFLEGR